MHLSYILGGSGRGRGMSHRQETRSWVPLAPIYLRVFSLHISCSFVFHSISSVSNFFSFYQVFLDANQWAGSGRLGVGGRWRIFLGKGDKVKARSFALTWAKAFPLFPFPPNIAQVSLFYQILGVGNPHTYYTLKKKSKSLKLFRIFCCAETPSFFWNIK